MKAALALVACVAGCHPSPPVPAAARAAPAVELIPLAPVPVVHTGAALDWCWAAPRALRPTDLGSLYVAVQVERAIASCLLGVTSDDVFPHLGAVRASGNPIYLVGPVALDPRDLAPPVHAARTVESALAAAWDHGQALELVQIALVGYVQDSEGHDAQRFTFTLRHLPAERSQRGRGTTSAELCVIGQGDSLEIRARIISES